jgi:hypothetical protein
MEKVQILDRDILVQAEKGINRDYKMIADKVNGAANDAKNFASTAGRISATDP